MLHKYLIIVLLCSTILFAKNDVSVTELSGEILQNVSFRLKKNIIDLQIHKKDFILDFSQTDFYKKKKNIIVKINNFINFFGPVPKSQKLVFLNYINSYDFEEWKRLLKPQKQFYRNKNIISKKNKTAREIHHKTDTTKETEYLVKETIAKYEITIPSILFQKNSYLLTNKAKKILLKLQKYFSKGYKEIQINGYTDDSGSEKSNIKLSRKRALTVKKFLIQNLHIDETKIFCHGYGSKNPVASNSIESGREKNRRVVIEILKDDQ